MALALGDQHNLASSGRGRTGHSRGRGRSIGQGQGRGLKPVTKKLKK